MLKKGLVQIYTGEGKGKTTASLGLALRSAGRGNRVFIYQFLKPDSVETGEMLGLGKCGLDIILENFEAGWDMLGDLKDERKRAQCREIISRVLERVSEYLREKTYDVIILDEIVFCLSSGLVSLADISKMVDSKDDRVELVMTGRGASRELIELADLVTEMKKIKHPFDRGIEAREGIEF